MNNDLISREALKDITYINKGNFNTVDGIREWIDNAPTVCGNNQKWCESCVSKGKCASTRPQGEWGKWVISEIRCPNCLEYFQTDCYSMGELDKCPNCGAKMITDESQ